MKGKIFIVDDDPKIGRLLKFKLARADYDAEYFNNAAEALSRIPDLKPHLVISDIQMPHMNGYEFCEKLRQDARTASIPFIFLSGKTDTSDQLEGLRLGADDYVCKPVKINFLMERMEKVLERAARARTFKSLADFSGHLSRMTINDVMQIVEANHKTGELEFSTTDGKTLGRILFRRGNLIKAQFRELDGAEAFYGLMDEADGYFEFYARDVNEPEQITITNMAALLQGSRLIDEAKALYRHLPDLNITLNVNTSDIPHEVEDRCGRERVHRILSMLGRKLSVDEALSGSRMSRPRSASIIADLLRHNIVSIPKKEKAVLKPISAAPPRISIEAWLIKALRSIEERRATGVLEIGNLPEREMIFCQEGHIINAFHGKTTGKKALYRIFAGQGGTPRFDPYPVIVNRLVNDSLEYLIEDGNREVETLRLLRQMPFNNRIQVNQQQMEKVSRIKSRPGLKDVLALVMQHGRIRDVIDASSFTDLRTYNHLLTLVKLNVIEIEKDGGTTAGQA